MLRHLLLFGWLPLALVAPARAHLPTESTAVARLQHGRLEVCVTMSPEMAATLLNPGPAGERLDATSFARLQSRLLAAAGGLFEVSASGQTLVPQRTAVALNKTGEPEFVLIFPAPPAWPLRIRASFLGRLPDGGGFETTLDVFDETEKLLGSKLLTGRGTESLLVGR